MQSNARPYVAELVGTFSLVFVGAGAVCMDKLCQVFDGPRLYLGGIAVAQAAVLAVGLAATVPFSGGYLNPAVTLMLWVFKKMDGAKASGLIFCQLLGAALAGGLIRLIFSFREDAVLTPVSLGTPHVSLRPFDATVPTLPSLLTGIGLEIVLTFILTCAIFATLIDPRAPKVLGKVGKWLSGLWVGLALLAVTLVGFGLTGASVNPARWFGTWIWEFTVSPLKEINPSRDHMVYWIGPIIGALLGGGVYTALILPPETEPSSPATAGAGAKVSAGASSTLFRAKK